MAMMLRIFNFHVFFGSSLGLLSSPSVGREMPPSNSMKKRGK